MLSQQPWHSLGDARGLDLDATLTSGQCFRWQRQYGTWQGVSGGHAVQVKLEDGRLLADCPADQDDWWRRYFALDMDYAALHARFAKSRRLAACVAAAPGLRVLRQPFFEVLCSFLISQNNNIPRIRGIIGRLCDLCGEVLPDGQRAFPTPQALAAQTPDTMAVLRAGWRADYLLAAARAVAEGKLRPEHLAALPLDQARDRLMTLRGVGPKVADCVLLYGLGFWDAWPSDVWMKRAMPALFPKGMPRAAAGYRGIAQQYIFEYARRSLPRGTDKKGKKSPLPGQKRRRFPAADRCFCPGKITGVPVFLQKILPAVAFLTIPGYNKAR